MQMLSNAFIVRLTCWLAATVDLKCASREPNFRSDMMQKFSILCKTCLLLVWYAATQHQHTCITVPFRANDPIYTCLRIDYSMECMAKWLCALRHTSLVSA